MTKFQEFKEKFNNINISKMIDTFRDFGTLPLKELKVIEFNDDCEYDSYGSENSHLSLVVYDSILEIYIKYTGNRSSYNGEDWEDDFKEVFPNKKIITYYE